MQAGDAADGAKFLLFGCAAFLRRATGCGYRRTLRLIAVVWLREPETPVMVTVLVPVVAVLLAVNVRVLVPVAGFGLNAAVTPLPRPLADRVTLPAKPLVGWIVIVVVPCDDRVMVKLVGDAVSVKLPVATAVTVRLTVAFCVMLPPVPVTVMVYVPVAVVAATAMLMVEVPEPGAAMDAGLKLTVTPVGWPDAVKAMAELKPPETVVVIVDEPFPPWTTETEAGEAEMVKLGVVEVGAKALIKPVPFGLPQPVTRS